MRLFISIFSAALGSVLGGAVRAAADTAHATLNGDEAAIGSVNATASLTAGVLGGFVGSLIGGPRRAFWLGALLGAAGADRFDAMLLSRFGLDPNALVARATQAAARVRSGAMEDDPEAVEA
jgi:hypothetical protein